MGCRARLTCLEVQPIQLYQPFTPHKAGQKAGGPEDTNLEHLFQSIVRLDEKLQELGVIEINGIATYEAGEEVDDV